MSIYGCRCESENIRSTSGKKAYLEEGFRKEGTGNLRLGSAGNLLGEQNRKKNVLVVGGKGTTNRHKRKAVQVVFSVEKSTC